MTARFFEAAYQQRYTAAAILATQGIQVPGKPIESRTDHLTASTSISDASVAPGSRISLVAQVTPARGMHVYAPGKHSYRVVQLIVDSQPWLRVHDAQYSPSELYHFKPLDERVEVYSKPFRLTRDVTILVTRDVQKLLGSTATVTLTGALEYQACDDRVCYNPARLPLSFTLTVRPLDR